MTKFRIDVRVTTMESFYLDADTEEHARASAVAKVYEGDWQNVAPDTYPDYEVADIESEDAA